MDNNNNNNKRLKRIIYTKEQTLEITKRLAEASGWNISNGQSPRSYLDTITPRPNKKK